MVQLKLQLERPILYVFDKSEGYLPEDIAFLYKVKNEGTSKDLKVLVLMNKCDLPDSYGSGHESSSIELIDYMEISAGTGQGLHELYTFIGKIFLSDNHSSIGDEILTRERHRVLIEKAAVHVQTAMCEFELGTPEDLVAIELRAAYIALGEILGLEIGDDIVDRIFSEFCVGK